MNSSLLPVVWCGRNSHMWFLKLGHKVRATWLSHFLGSHDLGGTQRSYPSTITRRLSARPYGRELDYHQQPAPVCQLCCIKPSDDHPAPGKPSDECSPSWEFDYSHPARLLSNSWPAETLMGHKCLLLLGWPKKLFRFSIPSYENPNQTFGQSNILSGTVVNPPANVREAGLIPMGLEDPLGKMATSLSTILLISWPLYCVCVCVFFSYKELAWKWMFLILKPNYMKTEFLCNWVFIKKILLNMPIVVILEIILALWVPKTH